MGMVAGLLAMLAALLAGCRDSPPPELPGAASEPAGAVRQLADHLRSNDLAAFARDALPPAEHGRLAAAWSQDHSRWPLTELPLDDRLPGLLAGLAAPGSEARLRREFDEVWEPTTRMRSQLSASCFTASCRLVVA